MSLASPSSNLPRSAGVLLHITSLPGGHGIGDLGPAAFAWIDLLASAKQHWWQILPLGPLGEGFSPYSSFSAFAGNPLLISPQQLARDGWLSFAEARPPRILASSNSQTVDYPRVERHKSALLQLAWERLCEKAPAVLCRSFDRFRATQAHWLDDFALFMALRQRYEQTPWTQWPKLLMQRQPPALAIARQELATEIRRESFFQFLFYRQLAALRRYAAQHGVKIIGDLPIFVAGESADVWANPHLFLLDRHRRPKTIAGVPPDYFSKTGQLWGNPMYDWPAMQRDRFAWWVARFRTLLQQVDLVRIDHFRGFAGCWHIPAGTPDARGGKWVKSPGAQLFTTVNKQLGRLPFIAEDLGLITPDVHTLRDTLRLPGMRVLQFAFGDDSNNPFLPHNYVHNAVAYTGTHDNDTTVGWYAGLNTQQRRHLLHYAPWAAKDPAGALIRLAWASVADVAIAPMQDVLRLGAAARMNTPGTTEGNWTWRLPNLAVARKGLRPIAALTESFGRALH